MSNVAPVVVICDAGPLIHLDELNALDLLADFDRILAPNSFCSEVRRHRPTVFTQKSVSIRCVAPPESAASAAVRLGRLLSLHQGEIDALALAKSTENSLLLTDDNAARLAATNLSIRVHGTLGVLLRAVRRGQRSRSAAVELLHDIPFRTTLHIKRDLLLDAIKALE
ncbi:MAG: DNA-binding protein [Candidatus Hydrogenedentes bacterium]|nr:DNA-binding protein [Candidatus Hydrogenedentota bacterium]